MISQKNAAKFFSDDGKIVLLCDADSSLGNIHDFLLMLKGNIVERMVSAQKEEQSVSDKIKEIDAQIEQQNLPMEDSVA